MTTKKRNAPDGSKMKAGSRAAKRRAKQKERQQLRKAHQEAATTSSSSSSSSSSAFTTEVTNGEIMNDDGMKQDQVEANIPVTDVSSMKKKKRKKDKKKKKQLPLGNDDDDDDNNDDNDDNDDNNEQEKDIGRIEIKDSSHRTKKKKVKIQKESDNGMEEKITPSPMEKEGENDDESEVNDDDEERENMLLDQFISHLTPAEILFPETFLKDKSNEKEVDVDEDSNENISDEMMMIKMMQQQQQQQPDPLEIASNLTTEKRANRLFKSIIAPSGLSTNAFYEHYWEKKPLLISTSENLAEPDSSTGAIYGDDLELEGEELEVYKKRFDGFLSKESIQKLISEFPMKYGTDLNVTNYCDSGSGEKRRITLDQLPNDMSSEDVEYIDAESNDVWSNFKSGCTLRLLCPQVSKLVINLTFFRKKISFWISYSESNYTCIHTHSYIHTHTYKRNTMTKFILC